MSKSRFLFHHSLSLCFLLSLPILIPCEENWRAFIASIAFTDYLDTLRRALVVFLFSLSNKDGERGLLKPEEKLKEFISQRIGQVCLK